MCTASQLFQGATCELKHVCTCRDDLIPVLLHWNVITDKFLWFLHVISWWELACDIHEHLSLAKISMYMVSCSLFNSHGEALNTGKKGVSMGHLVSEMSEGLDRHANTTVGTIFRIKSIIVCLKYVPLIHQG